MKIIDVSTRKFPSTFALVDDEDYEQLMRFKWSATKPQNVIYAVRPCIVNGKKTTIRMHREVLKSSGDIDHKDGNGLNNQKSNLRECSNTQNQMNRATARGASKFKGVSWHKSTRKWRATIVVNKRQIALGYFHREIEAAYAYDTAAIKYFGEFSRINNYE